MQVNRVIPIVILGFHVMSEKTKIQNFDLIPLLSERHFKDISAGLFSAR